VSDKSSEIIAHLQPPPVVGSVAGSIPPQQPIPPPFNPNRNTAAPPVFWPKANAATDPSNSRAQVESLNTFKISAAEAPKPSASEPQELDDPSESLPLIWIPFTLRETPSWLISLTVHVAIILLLALIPLSEQIGTSISILAGLSEVEDSGEAVTVLESQADSSELEASRVMAEMPEVDIKDLVVTDFTPSLNAALQTTMTLSKALTGRTGPSKDALLKAYGGTQGTEDAVEAGLKWLERNQRSDGSWSLVGPYSDGGVTENKPAATAMAMLAFMGAGNTHQSGTYKVNVLKGLNAIRRFQDQDGFFAEQSAGNQRTYAQAQCTIAVCELYGMTGDAELKEMAQSAVRYCEKAQGKAGGWRYQPREGGDTSVTGWYVMALISARMAGLDVDSEVLEKVNGFLDTVQRYGRSTAINPEGERYAYQSFGIAIPSMTAEGMLCRVYLGWSTKDQRIERGAEFLNSQPISTDKGRISYYYWYYATTALHHLGGSHWKTWNQTMKVVLPEMQLRSGKERGSWPPGGDPHEGGGGRLYATCFAIYCLESYYRHLPLSEMAPKQ